MQVHGPSAITDEVRVSLNPGGDNPPFAVLTLGHVDVYIYDTGEADKLIEAVTKARRLLTREGESK